VLAQVAQDPPGYRGDLAAVPGTVSRIAGYRLETQVGAGGMAVVYRARDERLGRRVALKIMAPAMATHAMFRQRFTRRSRAAAAVDHPHIIGRQERTRRLKLRRPIARNRAPNPATTG
jgi:serine/threonine protein kinase